MSWWIRDGLKERKIGGQERQERSYQCGDELKLTCMAVNCPSRWSLYLSLALCVDHLVGGENPIYAAVLVVLEQFFAKCKFCMPEEGMEKFRPFVCFLGPKNSPLLSGDLTRTWSHIGQGQGPRVEFRPTAICKSSSCRCQNSTKNTTREGCSNAVLTAYTAKHCLHYFHYFIGFTNSTVYTTCTPNLTLTA